MKKKGQFNYLLKYFTIAVKGCWKRSKTSSSYITPGGVTFHFDTHKLVRRLQENGTVYLYIIFLNKVLYTRLSIILVCDKNFNQGQL